MSGFDWNLFCAVCACFGVGAVALLQAGHEKDLKKALSRLDELARRTEHLRFLVDEMDAEMDERRDRKLVFGLLDERRNLRKDLEDLKAVNEEEHRVLRDAILASGNAKGDKE